MSDKAILMQEQLPRLARMALGHVEREYPNHLMLVMNESLDNVSPRALHPVFYGSFDWHSSVHSYWLLARLLRYPLPEEIIGAIQHLFDRAITAKAVGGEVAYFQQPGRSSFERPYGWAWLLKLAKELRTSPDSSAQRAGEHLRPLETLIVESFLSFWPKQVYPIRTGTHANSAFATILALDYSHTIETHFPEERENTDALTRQLEDAAREWFIDDRHSQAWEPGGDEFLSPTLIEALCMKQVLPPDEFESWLGDFLPFIAKGAPATLFSPALVTDRSDGKLAHLDGLNISRAWCWLQLASSWKEDDPRRERVFAAVDKHLLIALDHIDEDYMGSHWLASFVLLALESLPE